MIIRNPAGENSVRNITKTDPFLSLNLGKYEHFFEFSEFFGKGSFFQQGETGAPLDGATAPCSRRLNPYCISDRTICLKTCNPFPA